MDMCSTTLLELHLPAVTFHRHRVGFVHYNVGDEGLDTMVKVAGGSHDIALDQCMQGLFHLFFQELLDWFPLPIFGFCFNIDCMLTIIIGSCFEVDSEKPNA